ncbi:arsenic transporter [Labrys monachus]|uniref:Arsenical pump membrane protein n=1 Tax=Labrys monachus TaxID=217067 RepID=A0ABU0FM86_9HYPH|nr:arsenic transporter [Labrys monachus]MDQ0395727.1 arsenical pump membrane protein [Labrys monachus]
MMDLQTWARADNLIWGIVGLSTAGVIMRPFEWPEAVWALAGAALLLALGLIPADVAWTGVLKGLDVYLFLTGMMLLSELARKEGLFDWLAALAVAHARGSPQRLFALIYAIGIVVTVFLSNDATAVVLTPAVFAATRAAKVKDPLPFLLICAFIANAASFVLPISNPANLVVFGGGHMPPLLDWLRLFTLPSILAIGVTFAALWLTQRRSLAADAIAADVPRPALTPGARLAGAGIVATAILLAAASALDLDLGLPTLVAGVATAVLVVCVNRDNPAEILRGISWGVLPLVAGLFILVEAMAQTGVIGLLASALQQAAANAPREAGVLAGTMTAFGTNLVNNLPAGLIAGSAIQAGPLPGHVAASILVGIDLGPNLSVTGSLATILWLAALRRDGQRVGAWLFLRLGIVVMTPALAAALAVLAWLG